MMIWWTRISQCSLVSRSPGLWSPKVLVYRSPGLQKSWPSEVLVSRLQTQQDSEFGPRSLFQNSLHVQQRLLQGLSQLGGVGVRARVEGRNGEVDVILHGVVTDPEPVGYHRTETHHAVRLRGDLRGKDRFSLLWQGSLAAPLLPVLPDWWTGGSVKPWSGRDL